MKAIAFDFDGTFLDTELTYFESWRSVFQDFSVPISLDLWVQKLWTYPQVMTPIEYLENLRLPGFDRSQVESVRRQRERALSGQLGLRPGILEALDWCARSGIPVGIVTGSSREWVFSHLNRLEMASRISCVITKEDTTLFKPNPAPYLKFAEKKDTAAGEILAIEDTPIGLKSAKAAGMKAIAYPNVITTSLNLSEADVICSHDSLLQTIQEFHAAATVDAN